MNQSKPIITFYRILGRICLISGMIGIVMFGIIGYQTIIDDIDDSFGSFIEVCLGFILTIILIGVGKSYIKIVSDFKLYSSWLAVNKTRSIKELADGVGSTQEIVVVNLNKMIRNKFFKDAYIDTNTNQIMFSDDYFNVECHSCGAINKIKPGIATKCEYCGSHIKYKQ